MTVNEQQILEERARRLALPLTKEEEKSVQVVSFSIGAEKFIIESQYVQEIDKLRDYTPVPDTPNFIVGVTNIRGTVLALVDIAKFFTMPSRGLTDLTRIIILGQREFEFGILAATAHDAFSIDLSDILDVPDGISANTKKYLKGVTANASLFLDGQILLSDERLILD
jgi:purine-binding chemotaxis protein CheW